MADALLTPVVERCVDFGFDAAVKHLGYIWNYKKNIKNLQTQVEKLDEERADKSRCVTVAEKNVQHIRDSVKGWQKRAEEFSKDAKIIKEEHEEEGKKRCLMGLCPSLVSRYQLSKRASEKETEIATAITEAEKFTQLADSATGLVKKIALSTKHCFTFESRNSVLEEIVKTLQDETMNCVGVYGLGGMGKTTLAKQAASQVAEEKMFEEVVFASVTQKVDTKEIQGQIASMLDLKLKDSAVLQRASLIHERLKGKKVLVVLDDLWAELDLTQVGIPFGAEHMGCKVLLTSRFLPVLHKMYTTKDYDIRALKEDEAWRLFKEKAKVKNPTLLEIGKQIAKRCAGWPILIVTTAASLAKQTDSGPWNDALAKVKKMNSENMKSVIESISYNCLNETQKQLFLLCGLMQGDTVFDDLLKYSVGWDVFAEDEIVTVEDARNRLQTLIIYLKESCLLLDGDGSNNIKMHDVVRDIAISIAQRELHAFSAGRNTDTDLCRWPENDALKKCTAMIFLNCRELPCFPQRLECPSLEFFILCTHQWDSELKVPDTFFERTSKLKVLDMSGLVFPTLPSTLSFLTNIQSLHLDGCWLQDISMVGELKKLQVLSLVGSTIQELPSSLGQLSELKLLDLNRCAKLTVIPSGLISSLSKLEELHMSGCSYKWEYEECSRNNGKSNASIAELKCLHHLSTLKIKLEDAILLAEDLNFENWKRYEIIMGDYLFLDWSIGNTKILALQLSTNSIDHLQRVVSTLFKRTECLCLKELKGINDVIPRLNEDGFPKLKHLYISKDSDIQNIVNVEDKQHRAKASFPVLESLRLRNLLKVEKICNGGLMEGSFHYLTILNVFGCDRLESFFSFSTIIALPCLEEIKIYECELLKQVFSREEGETKTETIIFPQLSSIELFRLPNLTTFCSGLVEETTTREKVETITQPLFDEKVQFPSLKTLFIENLDSIRAIWPSPVDITPSLKKDSCENDLKDKLQEIPIFQNLSEVTINRCASLKFLFSAYMSQPLKQLMKVCVQDCGVDTMIVDDEDVELEKLETGTTKFTRSLNQLMKVCVPHCGVETMIGDEEDAELEKFETGTTTFTLPKLVKMKLQGLPELEFFYPKELTIELPALKELAVADCDKLYVSDLLRCSSKQGDDRVVKVSPSFKRVSIKSKKVSTSSELADPNILDRLEELYMTECPLLINLAPSSVSFRLLKTLQFFRCDGLINLLQPSAAKTLEQLERLIIMGCEMIEEIIGGEGRDDDKESPSSCRDDEIIFNQLLYLRLQGLQSLTHFCSSSNYTFSFPKLTHVYVVECPNMKTFCGGIVTTPQLNTVIDSFYRREERKARWEGELNTTIEKIYEKREAQRLAIKPPSILATNHSEAQAQEERVAGTCTFEKSKGKEIEVPEQAVEHFEKSETPRYSDPSCSNYTTSSSQITPQISDNPDEVSHLPTQVEAQRLTVALPSTSSSGQFEQEIESHEKSIEELTEPIKEIQISKHVIDEFRNETEVSQETTNHSEAQTQKERVADTCERSKRKEVEVSEQGVEHFDKSEIPRYSDPSCNEDLANKESEVCENVATGPRIESEICDQVVEMDAQGLTLTLPSTSSKELTERTKEGQISKHDIDKLGNENELCDNVIEPKQVTKISSCLETEAETGNFIPLIRESVRALEAQPMSSLNAEHVHFVKKASDWLCAYANKATKLLERNNEISDLKREIAEKELKVRALQDENEATSSSLPGFE